MRERSGSLVSKQINSAELSDAEKRELITKVYPRLRKRARLMRLLRIGNALLLVMLMTACATTSKPPVEKAEKSKMVGMQIKKRAYVR